MLNDSKLSLQDKINNHDFFETNKEIDFALYRSNRMNLFELLYKYLDNYYFNKKRKIEDFGLEITSAFNETIKNFDKSRGKFLDLIIYLLDRNVRIKIAKDAIDENRKGIHITKSNDLLIRKIISFANSKNLDIHLVEVQEQIAKILDISIKEVEYLLSVNQNATSVEEYTTNEDDEEISIFDTIDSKINNPESTLFEKERLNSILDDLECRFLSMQNRPLTQKLISMLLTAKVLDALENINCLSELIDGRKFISNEILNEYNNNGVIPLDSEIANKCGVSINSSSRTFKNFINK